MEFEEISVSADGTHHLYEGSPLYESRFLRVGPFRFPGVAAAEDASGAFHITFLGEAAYPERYLWTGDFSDGVAPARDFDGRYLYINESGKPLSFVRYLYVTGFSEGSGVVYHEKYGATHITTSGEPLYWDWYYDARPFHSGRALVRDDDGWLAILPDGTEIERVPPPEDAFPISGDVRLVPLENRIPEVLRTSSWDAAVVLMRHGEREPFTKGESGSTKVLTTRGLRQSWEFGAALQDVPLRTYASPMLRCMQTGDAILEGSGNSGKTEASTMLGLPSAYVFDDDLVREFYVKNPVQMMSLRYVSGEELPGHYPVTEGSERLLRYLKGLLSNGKLSICITHDAWIVPFVAIFTGYDFTHDWPGFLDGCILFRRGNHYVIWWRDSEYPLKSSLKL